MSASSKLPALNFFSPSASCFFAAAGFGFAAGLSAASAAGAWAYATLGSTCVMHIVPARPMATIERSTPGRAARGRDDRSCTMSLRVSRLQLSVASSSFRLQIAKHPNPGITTLSAPTSPLTLTRTTPGPVMKACTRPDAGVAIKGTPMLLRNASACSIPSTSTAMWWMPGPRFSRKRASPSLPRGAISSRLLSPNGSSAASVFWEATTSRSLTSSPRIFRYFSAAASMSSTQMAT